MGGSESLRWGNKRISSNKKGYEGGKRIVAGKKQKDKICTKEMSRPREEPPLTVVGWAKKSVKGGNTMRGIGGKPERGGGICRLRINSVAPRPEKNKKKRKPPGGSLNEDLRDNRRTKNSPNSLQKRIGDGKYLGRRL